MRVALSCGRKIAGSKPRPAFVATVVILVLSIHPDDIKGGGALRRWCKKNFDVLVSVKKNEASRLFLLEVM